MSKDSRKEARARRRKRRIRRRREANKQLESFGHINWDVYDHRDMWNMVKSARPSQMGDKAYRWADLASKADAATEEVRKTSQRLLMSWRGDSAVTAADAISELTKWGAEASGTARTIGDRLDTYTHAVQEAQRRMPEPVHPVAEQWFADGKDVTVLDGPNGSYMLEQLLDDHEPTKKEQQRRKAEAVEVMRSYEGTSRGVHATMPGFDKTPVTTTGPNHYTGPPPVSGGGPGPLGSGIPGGSGGPSGTGGPGGYGAGTGATTAASVGYPGTAGLPGGSGSTYGALPGGGLPGSGGFGPGGPGGGAGGPFGAGPGAGAAGGLLAGPNSGAGSGSAAAAAQRAAMGLGARGGAGMPFGMMPPGGAGQRGDNEVEHRDKYGLGMDLMDDMPPAYPAVFGDD